MEEQQEIKKNWHDRHYKILLIIPLILLIFSFVYMINFYNKHGDFIQKDISLTGGTSVTLYEKLDVLELEQALQNKFKEVNFLIPHSAYSAATMLALSGNSVVLHPSATLGPIDPQVGVPTKEGTILFVPAKSILNGFAKAKKLIKNEGPETLPAYIPLIEKYSLDLFELCEDSEKLSKELVSSWLKKYMFAGERNNSRKIKKAASYFSDYNTHKIHSRPLTPDKLSGFSLKLEVAENPLRDLLWEAYILLNGFFNISPFVKLYECTHGVSWGKQFQIIIGPLPAQPQPKQKP